MSDCAGATTGQGQEIQFTMQAVPIPAGRDANDLYDGSECTWRTPTSRPATSSTSRRVSTTTPEPTRDGPAAWQSAG